MKCNYSDDCQAEAVYMVQAKCKGRFMGFYPMCAEHFESLKGTDWVKEAKLIDREVKNQVKS